MENGGKFRMTRGLPNRPGADVQNNTNLNSFVQIRIILTFLRLCYQLRRFAGYSVV